MKPIFLFTVLLTGWWFAASASAIAADEPPLDADTKCPVVRGPSMKTIEQFEKLVAQWQTHCDAHQFSSNRDVLLKTPAYTKLTQMGRSIVPLIFKRWKSEEEKKEEGIKIGPPWEYLLRELTMKEVITPQDRVEGFPDGVKKLFETGVLDITAVDVPELEKKRWFQWWENEGKKSFEQ